MLKVASILLLASTIAHALPALDAGVFIKNGSSDLQVSYYSAPTVVDWNNDGKKDLVVGQFYYGNVVVFLNVGTDANPVFNGGAAIQSGGVDITTSYG
jgi:hypothetical protein